MSTDNRSGSALQEAIEIVEALPPESQEALLNVIGKRLAERGRARLVEDVAEARVAYSAGKVRRGSASDVMAALDLE